MEMREIARAAEERAAEKRMRLQSARASNEAGLSEAELEILARVAAHHSEGGLMVPFVSVGVKSLEDAGLVTVTGSRPARVQCTGRGMMNAGYELF